MKGVTIAVYRAFKTNPTATCAQLRRISSDDVAKIYQQGYWDKVHADDLATGVDLMVFDMAVNSGSHSAKILQATIGATTDGVIGPQTLAKANAIDAVTLINGLAEHQAAFYRSLSSFQHFGKGWLNRTHARQAAALAMITKSRSRTQRVSPEETVDFFALIKSIV